MRIWTISTHNLSPPEGPCAPKWCGFGDCLCYDERSHGYFFHAVAIAGALAAERSRGFREGWDIAYWDGPIVPKAPVHEPGKPLRCTNVRCRETASELVMVGYRQASPPFVQIVLCDGCAESWTDKATIYGTSD